jgi:glycosyltransferase involved in cell wall biosynthesis
LSGEKGLVTLLRSWSQVGNGRVLKIVGSGPLEHLAAEAQPGVEWLGWQSREQVLDLMRHAAVLILPSECYENFPLTLVEAYATGLPVIGSSGGSIAELVEDFGTGRLFRPGDVGELAEALRWALTHAEEMRVCGAGARAEFLRKYTASENYVQLLHVYEHAVAAGG